MNLTQTLYVAAANYSCGSYGAGSYDQNQACATSPVNPGARPSGAEGGLANTGYDVVIPLALGVAVVSAGAIMLVKNLLRNRKRTTNK